MLCVSLWIGPALGALERACLRSAQRQGHSVALYCYEPPAGVPAGVELRDARDILPAERIVRHRRTGSVSLFSNWFRYELQRRGLGTWIDADAYLLKPLDAEQPYLIGEYEPGLVNGGVLRMPPDSPLLPPLLAIFEEKEVPRWLPWGAWFAAHARRLATGRTGVAHMPWGNTGPRALTALARQYRIKGDPPEVFYPVRWQDAAWLKDPAIRLEDVIGPRTVSIHLWNERIRYFKDAPAPAGSFLARLQQEGALEQAPAAAAA